MERKALRKSESSQEQAIVGINVAQYISFIRFLDKNKKYPEVFRSLTNLATQHESALRKFDLENAKVLSVLCNKYAARLLSRRESEHQAKELLNLGQRILGVHQGAFDYEAERIKASILNNLAVLSFLNQDDVYAAQTFLQMKDRSAKNGSAEFKALLSQNMAAILFKQQMYQSALEYTKEALLLVKPLVNHQIHCIETEIIIMKVHETIKQKIDHEVLKHDASFRNKLLIMLSTYFTKVLIEEKMNKDSAEHISANRRLLERGYEYSQLFLGDAHSFTKRFKSKLGEFKSREAIEGLFSKERQIAKSERMEPRHQFRFHHPGTPTQSKTKIKIVKSSEKKAGDRLASLLDNRIKADSNTKETSDTPTSNAPSIGQISQNKGYRIRRNSSSNSIQRINISNGDDSRQESGHENNFSILQAERKIHRRIRPNKSQNSSFRHYTVSPFQESKKTIEENLIESQLQIQRNIEVMMKTQRELEEKVSKKIEDTLSRSQQAERIDRDLAEKELELQIETLKKENEKISHEKLEKELELEQLRQQVNSNDQSNGTRAPGGPGFPMPMNYPGFYPPFFPYPVPMMMPGQRQHDRSLGGISFGATTPHDTQQPQAQQQQSHSQAISSSQSLGTRVANKRKALSRKASNDLPTTELDELIQQQQQSQQNQQSPLLNPSSSQLNSSSSSPQLPQFKVEDSKGTKATDSKKELDDNVKSVEKQSEKPLKIPQERVPDIRIIDDKLPIIKVHTIEAQEHAPPKDSGKKNLMNLNPPQLNTQMTLNSPKITDATIFDDITSIQINSMDLDTVRNPSIINDFRPKQRKRGKYFDPKSRVFQLDFSVLGIHKTNHDENNKSRPVAPADSKAAQPKDPRIKTTTLSLPKSNSLAGKGDSITTISSYYQTKDSISMIASSHIASEANVDSQGQLSPMPREGGVHALTKNDSRKALALPINKTKAIIQSSDPTKSNSSSEDRTKPDTETNSRISYFRTNTGSTTASGTSKLSTLANQQSFTLASFIETLSPVPLPKSANIRKQITLFEDSYKYMIECKLESEGNEPIVKLVLSQMALTHDEYFFMTEKKLNVKQLKLLMKNLQYSEVMPTNMTLRSINSLESFVKHCLMPFIGISEDSESNKVIDIRAKASSLLRTVPQNLFLQERCYVSFYHIMGMDFRIVLMSVATGVVLKIDLTMDDSTFNKFFTWMKPSEKYQNPIRDLLHFINTIDDSSASAEELKAVSDLIKKYQNENIDSEIEACELKQKADSKVLSEYIDNVVSQIQAMVLEKGYTQYNEVCQDSKLKYFKLRAFNELKQTNFSLLIENMEDNGIDVYLKNFYDTWAPHNKKIKAEGKGLYRFESLWKDFAMNYATMSAEEKTAVYSLISEMFTLKTHEKNLYPGDYDMYEENPMIRIHLDQGTFSRTFRGANYKIPVTSVLVGVSGHPLGVKTYVYDLEQRRESGAFFFVNSRAWKLKEDGNSDGKKKKHIVASPMLEQYSFEQILKAGGFEIIQQQLVYEDTQSKCNLAGIRSQGTVSQSEMLEGVLNFNNFVKYYKENKEVDWLEL